MVDLPENVRLTRRALLKIGALAGGGLVLGMVLPTRADPPPTPADAMPEPAIPSPADPPAKFAPNAWIRIHGDGRIQLVLARSEMGQGVMTTLPMLLAEELEVGLDQIEIELAPIGSDYINRLLGEQATGESTSLRDAWTGLREAGAVARRLLINAAATTWGVPDEECQARRGRVHHADGTRSLAYAELAVLAADLPVSEPSSEPIALKSPDTWTLIGTRPRRLDTPDKVTGQARYGLDVRLPGMLYATIERCPILESHVRNWRGDAARKIPGVIDILTVRHGVAVVAETSWAALRAREILEIDCRPSTNSAADSERIRARFRAALTGRAALAHRQGDVSAALDAAHRQVEVVYEVPFQAHACLEPMNCSADVGPDRCAVYVPTQDQQGVRETARRLTGLPAERIAVHTTLLGGGFGRRREQDFVIDAVELSKLLGRPVQVIWTREDDLRHDFYRPMTLHRLRGGLDEQGQPTAWFHRIVGPSLLARVRPSDMPEGLDPTLIAGAADLVYAIAHRRVEYRRADTPVPVGFWRGGGHTQNAFVTECFLDELARLAGQDPLALRRTLLADRPRHRQVLELAAERADWSAPPMAERARGIALAEAFGSFIATVAEVSASAGQIRVHRVVCAVDCGQVVHPEIVRAQIEGGVVFGLTATLKGAITLSEGRVEQGNFADYPLLRFDEMPAIEVHLVRGDAAPGGVSGLGTPPIAPAVANALSALTGQPVRSLPIQLGG
ncbi:xanthine dehydrogenase family protein molybdopterin-binding subunit [Thiocystis violascens]|uniref:Aerobic-type carbon monoxide dehydrogenase, large subunit CoxL/CutL-like protein n=1 Tax=Thiocystis violascens (strain ATCC 17096 / DSM 198 / 6111) TaxID=765911 RepID=I3YCH0_THIV6|nr:xanthine dehydrogenase family protein molybdopterin-binding subunit [Thiocystis violascens]AFL74688.1 aerobic-type carbon monoxide dehydrogenase, large subunit CoxL/CutL-like protein [Thiocystis violascens DSM 198]